MTLEATSRKPLSRAAAFIRTCYFVAIAVAVVGVALNASRSRESEHAASRKSFPFLRGKKFHPLLLPSETHAPSHPASCPTNFLYYIPYFLSTSLCVTVIQIPIVIYVDINGNPRGCPVAARSLARSLTRPRPGGERTLQRRPHPPSSGSRYYALLNQSCHCYCWLRAVSPFPIPFSCDRFLASPIPRSLISRLPTRCATSSPSGRG